MSTRRRNPGGHRTSGQAIAGKHLVMHCRPCDLLAYPDKAHAQDRRKQLRHESKLRGDHRPLSAFRCPENPAQWHIGHDRIRAEEVQLQYFKHGVS